MQQQRHPRERSTCLLVITTDLHHMHARRARLDLMDMTGSQQHGLQDRIAQQVQALQAAQRDQQAPPLVLPLLPQQAADWRQVRVTRSR